MKRELVYTTEKGGVVTLIVHIPRNQKLLVVDHIRAYLDEELAQQVGELAAESLLDFIVKEVGPFIYNQAVADARTVIANQAERIDEELYALEHPPEIHR